jgi:hypothetical protein
MECARRRADLRSQAKKGQDKTTLQVLAAWFCVSIGRAFCGARSRRFCHIRNYRHLCAALSLKARAAHNFARRFCAALSVKSCAVASQKIR